MTIFLTRPNIDRQDLNAMAQAVYSCAITHSKITNQFERTFADYMGTPDAVAVNSGTSALILALRVIDIGPGHEVILPSYTCLAVVNAVVQVGAKPILADNDCCFEDMNYNLQLSDVKNRITSRTKAIVLPHMFGVSGKADELVKLGIPLIEDITLSLGSKIWEKPIGLEGMITVTSLHASKMMTSGEGGMITSKSKKICDRIRYLNGWESEQAYLRIQEKNFPQYELRYNFHMSGIAAALGISQIKKLNSFVARRRDLAEQYNKRLENIPSIICPNPLSENIFFRYLIALKKKSVVEVIKDFSKVGIEVGRGVYPPLHRLFRLPNNEFLGAEKATKSLISIPLYPSLTEQNVEYILSNCEEILTSV